MELGLGWCGLPEKESLGLNEEEEGLGEGLSFGYLFTEHCLNKVSSPAELHLHLLVKVSVFPFGPWAPDLCDTSHTCGP